MAKKYIEDTQGRSFTKRLPDSEPQVIPKDSPCILCQAGGVNKQCKAHAIMWDHGDVDHGVFPGWLCAKHAGVRLKDARKRLLAVSKALEGR